MSGAPLPPAAPAAPLRCVVCSRLLSTQQSSACELPASATAQSLWVLPATFHRVREKDHRGNPKVNEETPRQAYDSSKPARRGHGLTSRTAALVAVLLFRLATFPEAKRGRSNREEKKRSSSEARQGPASATGAFLCTRCRYAMKLIDGALPGKVSAKAELRNSSIFWNSRPFCLPSACT